MKSLLHCRKSLNVILPFTGKLLHNVNMFEMCAKKPHSQSILIKNAIKYSIQHHKSYFIHFNNSLYNKPNIKCSIILLLYLNILYILFFIHSLLIEERENNKIIHKFLAHQSCSSKSRTSLQHVSKFFGIQHVSNLILFPPIPSNLRENLNLRF